MLALFMSFVASISFANTIVAENKKTIDSKMIDQLAQDKLFLSTTQMIIDLSSTTVPYLKSPAISRVQNKKANAQELNTLFNALGFKTGEEFAHYESTIANNFKILKSKYADVFNSESLLREVLKKALNSKALDKKTFLKKTDCFLEFLLRMEICNGIGIGVGEVEGPEGDLGLALWTLCLQAAYIYLENCE